MIYFLKNKFIERAYHEHIYWEVGATSWHNDHFNIVDKLSRHEVITPQAIESALKSSVNPDVYRHIFMQIYNDIKVEEETVTKQSPFSQYEAL